MTLDGHQDAVTCLNLTHDGMKIITGSLDYSLKFWDLSTGKVRLFEECLESRTLMLRIIIFLAEQSNNALSQLKKTLLFALLYKANFASGKQIFSYKISFPRMIFFKVQGILT